MQSLKTDGWVNQQQASSAMRQFVKIVAIGIGLWSVTLVLPQIADSISSLPQVYPVLAMIFLLAVALCWQAWQHPPIDANKSSKHPSHSPRPLPRRPL